MNKKFTLLGLSAALLLGSTLTSCNKDETADNGPQFLELEAAGPVSGKWAGNSIVTITEDVVVPEGQSSNSLPA